MRYIFAGDRDIAVDVLSYIISKGYKPEALLLSSLERASHANELIKLSKLPGEKILRGKAFASKEGFELLKRIKPDYIIGIHFPYIISVDVLNFPKVGFINLHPAYLPYNRGWHTQTWALLDSTPIGATLHFMAEQLDAGDIIYQKEIIPEINDTANTLYSKLKKLELEVFKTAWPDLVKLKPSRIKQDLKKGTAHQRKNLFTPEVQELDLAKSYKLDQLIQKLRALTTNDLKEAAYFYKNGQKFKVQILITPVNE
jgi:methionyl-tRNA formyltransferase